MSDKGTHFINNTIRAPTEEFEVYHKKSTPYHLQENGIVKAFNKILENALTKICNVNRAEWDSMIQVVLWAYRTVRILHGRHHLGWCMDKKQWCH
jgi:hypothetical protein